MKRLLKRGLRWLEARARTAARGCLQLCQRCSAREWPEADLGRPAMVFAPHPDDEALGCGGTILRKRRLEARVQIVFMTDGSQSHAHRIGPAELKALRAREAVAASEALGVSEENVILLEFPDGKLSEHHEQGVLRVAEILKRNRPAEVFIPHYHDGPPDHLATTNIVKDALRASGHEAEIYEYPVWLWCHWPWVGLPEGLRQAPAALARAAVADFRLIRDCRRFVRMGDLLDLKRAGLARHRTQMDRFDGDSSWTTLGDIAAGDWLACLLQDREVFYRHR